jgi:hypothetical protein
MSSTGTRLRLLAAMAAGAGGFLAGAYGLGIGGWPATISFVCGAALIAATCRSDRIGFLGAWLGALAAATALTVGGGHISDPEFGIGFAAFIIAAGTLVDGVALGASFLVAALIRRSAPSVADSAIPVMGSVLILVGLLIVGLVPSVLPADAMDTDAGVLSRLGWPIAVPILGAVTRRLW